MMADLQAHVATEFLQWWFGGLEGWLEITLIRGKGQAVRGRERPTATRWYLLPDDWEEVEDDMEYNTLRNRAGDGVYFGVSLHGEDTMKGGVASRPFDHTASVTPGLWIDADYDGDSAGKAALVESLGAFAFRPSMVIDSGGGLHGYWKFEEAAILNDTRRQAIKAMNKGLARRVVPPSALDTSVGNVSRLMRLPGFVNTKAGRDNAPCFVVGQYEDRHTPREMLVFADERDRHKPSIDVPAELRQARMRQQQSVDKYDRLPRFVRDYLAHGTGTNRNVTLFTCARHYAERGFSQGEAVSDLLPRALADGLDEREAMRSINRGFGYGSGARGTGGTGNLGLAPNLVHRMAVNQHGGSR